MARNAAGMTATSHAARPPAVVAIMAGSHPADARRAPAAAAKEGMEATIPLEARKGRASYLGPRSVGHQDPGATSSHLLLQAAAERFGG